MNLLFPRILPFSYYYLLQSLKEFGAIMECSFGGSGHDRRNMAEQRLKKKIREKAISNRITAIGNGSIPLAKVSLKQ
jgi:hypothetical protein